MSLRLSATLAAAAALAAGCSTAPLVPPGGIPSKLAAFSAARPGEPVPGE